MFMTTSAPSYPDPPSKQVHHQALLSIYFRRNHMDMRMWTRSSWSITHSSNTAGVHMKCSHSCTARKFSPLEDQKKLFGRWNAYRGDSTKSKDLLFIVKSS